MKTKMTLGLAALILGMATASFAGNRPAVVYPQGTLATAPQVVELTPWNKGALRPTAGIVMGTGAWYTHCPVMTNVILNSKHESEVTLSNGKRIMLSWAGLKGVVEANLSKYEPYMY